MDPQNFKFETWLPCAELVPYILHFGTFEFSKIDDNLMVQEIFPANLSAINFISEQGIYQYSDDGKIFHPLFPISLIGPITKKKYNKLVGSGSGFVIIFSPFGLYRIFGIKVNQIKNEIKEADKYIDYREIESCRQRIFETRSIPDQIKIVEEFLLCALRKSSFDLLNMDKIVSLIESRKGKVEIESLSGIANMSFKTLERQFSEKVGYPPKLFSSITRFSNAVKMLNSQKSVIQVISACGYTDHAHMIKEFEKFTGYSPKKYSKSIDDLSRYLLEVAVKK